MSPNQVESNLSISWRVNAVSSKGWSEDVGRSWRCRKASAPMGTDQVVVDQSQCNIYYWYAWYNLRCRIGLSFYYAGPALYPNRPLYLYTSPSHLHSPHAKNSGKSTTNFIYTFSYNLFMWPSRYFVVRDHSNIYFLEAIPSRCGEYLTTAIQQLPPQPDR